MKAYSRFIVAARAKEANLRLLSSLPKRHLNYVYCEEHHIYPKCLTKADTNNRVTRGDCRPANMVLMTFSDHVQAHVLLAAVYARHFGLQTVAKRKLLRQKLTGFTNQVR